MAEVQRSGFVTHDGLWRALALAAASVGYQGSGGVRFDWAEAIPQRVWDELHEAGLVRTTAADLTGDAMTWTTTRGAGELLAMVTGASDAVSAQLTPEVGLVKLRDGWMHVGCPSCGRVREWPVDRAEEPVYCTHSSPSLWWGRGAPDTSWVRCVPVLVMEAEATRV